MRWGGQSLTSPLVTVMDVGSPDTPIDGLLALDVFAGRTITIDFAGRQLIVETPSSAAERIKDAISVPAHLGREIGGAALSVFIEAPTVAATCRVEGARQYAAARINQDRAWRHGNGPDLQPRSRH
jgi:hypothetical protein